MAGDVKAVKVIKAPKAVILFSGRIKLEAG